MHLFTQPLRFFLLDLLLVLHDAEACERPVSEKSDALDYLSTRNIRNMHVN